METASSIAVQNLNGRISRIDLGATPIPTQLKLVVKASDGHGIEVFVRPGHEYHDSACLNAACTMATAAFMADAVVHMEVFPVGTELFLRKFILGD